MTSVAAETGVSRRTVCDAVVLAATILVVAVLGTSCATIGSAGAGLGSASPARSPVVTGAWSPPSGGAESFDAIAALGESDAWIVGAHRPLPHGTYTLTKHWDGRQWKAVPCPSPGSRAEPTRSSLDAVAVDAPDDAWAVGSWSPIEHVPPSYPLIEHWNGAKWTLVPVPSSGGRITDLDLTAVAAISPTMAWAIGEGVTHEHFVKVFLGWNGARWRYLPSPGAISVSDPAVISADDIWVVGGDDKRRTLAERWDGSSWTNVPTPNAFKDRIRNSGLSAVAASSSSDVWAVGSYQSGPISLDRNTLVEHWDGTKWQLVPSPNGPPGVQRERVLSAVAVLSRTSVLAVGSDDSPVPLTEHWDGVHWTTVPNKLLPGVTFAYLISVVAVDAHYAWAIGDGDRGSFIEEWNGTSWRETYRARIPKTA